MWKSKREGRGNNDRRGLYRWGWQSRTVFKRKCPKDAWKDFIAHGHLISHKEIFIIKTQRIVPPKPTGTNNNITAVNLCKIRCAYSLRIPTTQAKRYDPIPNHSQLTSAYSSTTFFFEILLRQCRLTVLPQTSQWETPAFHIVALRNNASYQLSNMRITKDKGTKQLRSVDSSITKQSSKATNVMARKSVIGASYWESNQSRKYRRTACFMDWHYVEEAWICRFKKYM